MFATAFLLVLSFLFSPVLAAARQVCVDQSVNPGFNCSDLKGNVCVNGSADNADEEVESCYYNPSVATADAPCGVVLIDKNSKCNSNCRKILGDFSSSSLLENRRLISSLGSVFGVNTTTPSTHIKTIHTSMDSKSESKLESKSESNFVQPFIGICIPVLGLSYEAALTQFATAGYGSLLTEDAIKALTPSDRSQYLSDLADWKVASTGLVGNDYNRERCNDEILSNDAAAAQCKKCKDNNYYTYSNYYDPYPPTVNCVSSCEKVNDLYSNKEDKQDACDNAYKWVPNPKSPNDCHWNSITSQCESYKNYPKNSRCSSLYSAVQSDNFLYVNETQKNDALKACGKCKDSNFFSYRVDKTNPISWVIQYACESSCDAFLNDSKYAGYNTTYFCNNAYDVTDKKTLTRKTCTFNTSNSLCEESVSTCQQYTGADLELCKTCTDYRYSVYNYPDGYKFYCIKSCGDIKSTFDTVSTQKSVCNVISKGSVGGCTWTFNKECKSDKDMPKPKGWRNPNNAFCAFPSLFAALSALFLTLSYLL